MALKRNMGAAFAALGAAAGTAATGLAILQAQNENLMGIVVAGSAVAAGYIAWQSLRGHLRICNLFLRDPLTGLANKTLLDDRVERALLRAQRCGGCVAALYLDIDDFRRVKETFDQRESDRLLAAAAHRLSKAVRQMDTVARVGPDEFVVLLPEVEDAEGAVVVARKILAAFRPAIEIGGRFQPLGLSIGIGIAPDDGTDVDTLIRKAFFAMMESKRKGKNAAWRYKDGILAPACMGVLKGPEG
ncbi:GGDEF domain-containing protein [Telmatospirillum sp. J64-1]|uniref:GGDEF domain-containing protein n=1 Tax=Telmatospirillum sp. J64-1 TaxID=2502183 RepID=UPI00115CFAE0|nr:GGDEF domain-containing protein [Telmatospirillum sp. J64-1]